MSYPGPNYPGQNYPSGLRPIQPSGFGPSSPGQFGQQASDLYGVPEPPRSSGSGCLWTLAAVLGIGGLALVLCCGGFVWFVSSTPQASAAAKTPWNVAAIAPPVFPDRGAPQSLGPDEGNVSV